MPRAFFYVLGWVCVVLAVAGIALPLLPTTPFLLVALWSFARSSPAIGHWLREHNWFGRYIRDWDEFHIVPVKAKVIAVATMSASLLWLSMGTNAPWYAVAVTGLIMLCVASWLVTRPSRRPH